MDNLPYELLFSIAMHLDSPKDLCSFSGVSSLFLTVARDDRIWQQLSSRLYNIRPPLNAMNQSFYDLFTKILVPYGRYLGYWKSNEAYLGGLIHVDLNVSNGMITGEKIHVGNSSSNTGGQFFILDDDGDNDNEEEESSLNPVYNRMRSFTIDTTSHQIFCYECNAPHNALPWIKTFDSNETYFGLSHEALPADKRSSLVTHDHTFTNGPEEPDIYFMRQCSATVSIVYHPLSIPRPSVNDNNDHPLSRLNGLWVGTYGGHGLEILHLEFCREFPCPTTIDGRSKTEEIVPNVLVARKITGDRNVPQSQISFAAVYPMEVDSSSPISYEGIGQIAHTNYIDAQFIRTKVVPISEHVIKVTWYALYHSSFFKRCPF